MEDWTTTPLFRENVPNEKFVSTLLEKIEGHKAYAAEKGNYVLASMTIIRERYEDVRLRVELYLAAYKDGEMRLTGDIHYAETVFSRYDFVDYTPPLLGTAEIVKAAKDPSSGIDEFIVLLNKSRHIHSTFHSIISRGQKTKPIDDRQVDSDLPRNIDVRVRIFVGENLQYDSNSA